MTESNYSDEVVAVIGAGVIGCAVSRALTQSGRPVLLLDRADPAVAGASFGNVGHIATEQLQPLPCPRLLLQFWRELFAFGGPLDIPLRRLATLAPWIGRFGVAAFRQAAHTRALAPLVRSAADVLAGQLGQIGRSDLIRRNGHYAFWLGPRSAAQAERQRREAAELAVSVGPVPRDLLAAVAAASLQGSRAGEAVDGVWFPDSAHVVDPVAVAHAFATAALERGAKLQRTAVHHIGPRGDHIEIVTASGTLTVRTAVICAGAWSAPFLRSFGLHAPLEAERGYHVELPGHAALADSPILYADCSVVVTPMASRLRASSYLEFAGLAAPPDPRKPARLRANLRRLGYRCEPEGPSWMGPRPTLPDYLPGIGRAPGPHGLYYAVGHQHLGLTLSAITAELVADLVAARQPRFDVAAFDLRRFGLR